MVRYVPGGNAGERLIGELADSGVKGQEILPTGGQ
jgi:hypothetical protein